MKQFAVSKARTLLSGARRKTTVLLAFVNTRETFLCFAGFIFTLYASVQVVSESGRALAARYSTGDWGGIAGQLLFATVVTFLIYGGLVYVLTRWAYYYRLSRHSRVGNETLSLLFNPAAPALTVLVPSYREEEKVIFQTLMSAALQQYANKRIVLLIDDPSRPASLDDQKVLQTARTLPAKIEMLLQPMRETCKIAQQRFIDSASMKTSIDRRHEIDLLREVYHTVIDWFDNEADSYPVCNHADQAYVEKVLLQQRQLLRERLEQIVSSAAQRTGPALVALLTAEYARLVAVFDADVTSFERKQFENLSHEPNKAMNLNSYMGLFGGRYVIEHQGHKRYLKRVFIRPADIVVPDSDYVITLDADSILVPDYALRLVYEMEREENRRLAVIQTPYSAFPGAPGHLERIAGATTDIQFIIHQGFTGFNGTYWVGANALIRKSALNDIEEIDSERGYEIKRYIQDRTVIEDTESSVDLVDKGWHLHNYPERLAYSATPPDFGSLIIQRQRWANGGLIILPKLARYLARGPKNLAKLGEAFVRMHYLVSIAAVNLGLVLLLAVPLSETINTVWLPLTALAYFVLYARDLRKVGYRLRDMFAVYALNLLLIPVNLAGVFKSLQQAYSKAKIPFGRTPKIAGRTAAAPLFPLAIYALLINWSIAGVLDFREGFLAHGLFAMVNAAILLYALKVFVGFRESFEDVQVGMRPHYHTFRLRIRWSISRLLARGRRQASAYLSPVGQALSLSQETPRQAETVSQPAREAA